MSWKRIVCSLAVGSLPSIGLIFVVVEQLAEQRNAITASASSPVQVQSPAPEIIPPGETIVEDQSLLDQWSASWSTKAAWIAFVDQLNADQLLKLLDEIEATENFRSNGHLMNLRKFAFDRLAEAVPPAALSYAEEHFPFEERHQYIGRLLQRWAIDEPDRCQDWLEKYESSLPKETSQSKEWTDLLEMVTATRAEHPPTKREIARIWSGLKQAVDIQSAYDGNLIDDEGNSVGSIDTLVGEAKETGRWQASVEEIISLRSANYLLLWPMMHQWMTHDFEAVTSWVEHQPAGKQRDQLLHAMAWNPNNQDPLQFFDRSRLVEWEIEFQPDRATQSFRTWVGIDPGAASEWLSRHPEPTPPLEAAREKLAMSLARDDNMTALAWAMSISGEGRRDALCRQVCRYWNEIEPWAAKAWAKQNLGWTDGEIRERLK